MRLNYSIALRKRFSCGYSHLLYFIWKLVPLPSLFNQTWPLSSSILSSFLFTTWFESKLAWGAPPLLRFLQLIVSKTTFFFNLACLNFSYNGRKRPNFEDTTLNYCWLTGSTHLNNPKDSSISLIYHNFITNLEYYPPVQLLVLINRYWNSRHWAFYVYFQV